MRPLSPSSRKGKAKVSIRLASKMYKGKANQTKRNKPSERLKARNLAERNKLVVSGLVNLVCGIATTDEEGVESDYAGLVKRLRADLAELHPQIKTIVAGRGGVPAAALFPFLCRKFLEISLTAMLARLDPMRLIAARKNQLDNSYEFGRPNPASISWTGDILPRGKPPASIWDSQVLDKGLERSLLGWHVADVALAPALGWLAEQDNTHSTWLRELSSHDKPVEWLKARIANSYSALSKGVHAEFLLDDMTVFDESAIAVHLHDCYMLIGILAAASHVSRIFARSMPRDEVLIALFAVESEILSGSQA